MKLFIYFVMSYVIFAGIIFLFQRDLLYLPSTQQPKPADWHVADMHEVTLKTEDGFSLTAWYKPAQNDQATLVYFHGNGFHLGGRGQIVRPYLDAGYGVLLVSYRGYAGNPGKPTEQGLYQDGRAAMKFIQSQKIPMKNVVLYGESLGTGVAIQIATEYPVRAVVLVSPYSSIADVGQYHYFYLPVKLLLFDRFNSAAKIKNIHMPLLMIHSEQDEVIPVKFAKKLFDEANQPKEIIYLQNVSHNHYPDLSGRVIEFIILNE